MTGLVAQTPFIGRLIEEGSAIVEEAERRGIAIRLMGGVGIRVLLAESLPASFQRPYRDLDIIVRRRQRQEVEKLLSERGWLPATAFNALNGARRLLFEDPASDAQVDVFVESFEMCHTLPLADSLARPGPSLPATDLLMSKLQIVQLNAKDQGDCYALLQSCEVADGDHRSLEPERLSRLTSSDWGLQHTFELNLQRLIRGLDSEPGADTQSVTAAIDALAAAMDRAPKTRAWKVRARIGERKRWYDEPEEVDRSVDGG